MSTDIDLSEDFADDFPGEESPVLPALDRVYGEDALPEDLDFDAMLDIATSPDTPAPEGDLIPEPDAYQQQPEDAFDPTLEPDYAPDLGHDADAASDPTDDYGSYDDVAGHSPDDLDTSDSDYPAAGDF
ncbi:hypothetical protein QVA66_11250 [Staphylococcus chromogenes]|nr:hypothetical protein [Staphylococcus chromogenes]